ncbi:DEAD/DEAH box helicase [Kribbella sp. CA-293567]|uniref:DEAD/DEAH box helicase n=1 Tax=Kribbella sp. CA-293567 TaxID=3002436 RepID=UPI0022DE73CA|nr:DEAD/DEAH box helicase family protein [Kribbella sp. CA-293567]WBQ04413.1 DEAD/DEAH box helicase family protein [Kribbella sp. CA-293567]
MGYYGDEQSFQLLTASSRLRWRDAQRGALGVLLGHWSLPRQPPALISLPTGSGKTAVALAAPHLLQSTRVLVVVPSRDLRRQTVDAFQSQEVLRRIGALSGASNPTVLELSGTSDDWSRLYGADVVVALPNAISPAYYTDGILPPKSLFDLVIVDEAHHSPAPTWRAILDHFGDSAALLLTATPRRRDRQQLPGTELYHYPISLALDNGSYKPVEPKILNLPDNPTQDSVDHLIASEAIRLAGQPEHATSSIMVRARTRQRATALAELYSSMGIEVETLHSEMAESKRENLVSRVRSGECRAVAVVNMLGEGFDLPRLRIAAYHDKHRSLAATTQFLGRLARVDKAYPQPSVLITAQDRDVYPHLQGAVRELYAEDADWGQVLPGLIDADIAEARADRTYVEAFSSAPPSLALNAVTPSCSVVLYEVGTQSGYEPQIATGQVPDELVEGRRLGGQTIIYSAVNPTNSTLVIVTTATSRPRWHSSSPGLDAPTYDLHLVTWIRSPRIDEPHLLLVNSGDGTIRNQLRVALGAEPHAKMTDPQRLQDAFDALDRISVSSVGVRNTYSGSPGVPSYTMFSGSGVDRGLRAADTDQRALGHAIAQVGSGPGSFSAGVATGKSKYWEGRYLSLRNYEVFAADLASRYWLPTASAAGRLLPNVVRGRRLSAFPDSYVALIEHSPSIRNMGWRDQSDLPVAILDLRIDPSGSRTDERLPLIATAPADPDVPVWQGYQDLEGRFHCSGRSLEVHLGFASGMQLEDLLSAKPPTIFFLDGQTCIGPVIYDSRGPRTSLPPVLYRSLPWLGVDLEAETKKKAAEKMVGRSIHEELETYLQAQPKRAKHRWILCNDGSGEIADYIVIEADPGRHVTLSLWHAKAAGNSTPGVRVNDMQTVTQQAIKSRGYITDPGLWRTIGARLAGEDSPKITFVEGNERLLRLLCGKNPDHPHWGFAHRPPPIAAGRVAIAQPGLSISMLHTALEKTSPTLAAKQIREFLTVLHDAASTIAEIELLTNN